MKHEQCENREVCRQLLYAKYTKKWSFNNKINIEIRQMHQQIIKAQRKQNKTKQNKTNRQTISIQSLPKAAFIAS